MYRRAHFRDQLVANLFIIRRRKNSFGASEIIGDRMKRRVLITRRLVN